jgi:integrase/recombinase XerD
MRGFLQWQAENNYSPQTIENREVYLRYFIQWCDKRGLTKPPDIYHGQ